jgi:hypothetical protein
MNSRSEFLERVALFAVTVAQEAGCHYVIASS